MLQSVTLDKQGEGVRFPFGQKAIPAIQVTLVTVGQSPGRCALDVFTGCPIGTCPAAAAAAVVIFRTKTAGKTAHSDSQFLSHS